MASFDYRQFRTDASAAISRAAYSPKKLVLIHSGISLGFGLALSVLSYILGLGIAGTGGLSGIGTRTVLETIQSLLQMANLILLPFWQIGYIFTILHIARGQEANPHSLLSGFRYWGPVLRTYILQGVIYFAVVMLGAQIASTIYMLTPAAKTFYALMEEINVADITDPYALLENEAYRSAMMSLLPFIVVGVVILLIPVFYRLRFMEYVLMDEPERGAFYAMARSMQLTRRKCFQLFKLDLRFWWFYGLELLIAVVSYGDLLLPLAGVQLDMGADTAAFVFYIAALLCQLGLYVWKKNQVFATYSLIYDHLRKPPQVTVQSTTPSAPKMPWKY